MPVSPTPHGINVSQPGCLNSAITHAASCLVFIARQHAMHAERDIVVANPSVRLSVRPSNAGIVSKRMHISSHFFHDLVLASL